MREIKDNLWQLHRHGEWIVITTNGTIKRNGEAVMGRGVALQAKEQFPSLSAELGMALNRIGNVPHVFFKYKLITLPVKHEWMQQADLKLIEQSLGILTHIDRRLEASKYEPPTVYLPRPGCGNGGLKWEDVRPLCEKLPDWFIVVEYDGT
jgi:hypothetical protein